MSNIDHDGTPDISQPRGGDAYPVVQSEGGPMIGRTQEIITAQDVRIVRNEAEVIKKMQRLALTKGAKYVYSWEVRDRANNRMVTVEGPTIDLAMDLSRAWGNCLCDSIIEDYPDHWMIYGRFVDLETGFTVIRPFRQRKSQETGMKDADRRMDMVMQIGVSKAMRNAVVNALRDVVDDLVETAKRGLVEWVATHGDAANAFITETLKKFNIEIEQVEAVRGAPRGKWTNQQIARTLTDLRALQDNMVALADLFPSTEDAKDVKARKEAKKAEGKKGDQPKTAQTTTAKTKAEPKKAPEPPAPTGEDDAGAAEAETTPDETGEETTASEDEPDDEAAGRTGLTQDEEDLLGGFA